MKMEQSVIFVKKSLKIKISQVRDHCQGGYCTGKYKGAACSIYNLKYGIPNKIGIDFPNGSYDEMIIIIRCIVKKYSSILMQQLLQTSKFICEPMMN